MDDAIQKLGANARAIGFSVFSNPYLKSRNMPAATGETLAEWQAKHDAWEFGWRAEDAMRGQMDAYQQAMLSASRLPTGWTPSR